MLTSVVVVQKNVFQIDDVYDLTSLRCRIIYREIEIIVRLRVIKTLAMGALSGIAGVRGCMIYFD